LELADQPGFEGVCVNEHHQSAYGNMPSPNIIAACLARRTRHAKLAILGNVLPLYDHPQRLAEELAMLDVITKGRVISGMVVGAGISGDHADGIGGVVCLRPLAPNRAPRTVRCDGVALPRTPYRWGLVLHADRK
jgi:alkanesulfonate monooxygenase SsuD/methylene tetrahydromethanopterin reductase-like flavin-dependent oxidoreductase (luciferase family)